MINRYIISLLLGLTMLYYALPYLSFQINSGIGIFSITWGLFALLVIGGNLAGILYAPKGVNKGRRRKMSRKGVRKRQVLH